MRALMRLYSCTWYFSPPSRNDAPSMNSVLVTIAPAMEAFTSMYCPARRAVSAMTSSVRLPSVALSRPPTASPVLAATDSVAWLSKRGQRHDGQHRQDEEQRVRVVCELLGREHHRHEDQQPQQLVVPDFVEQGSHARSVLFCC